LPAETVMAWFVVRRFGLLVVALLVASVLVFLLLRLLPGDLAAVIGGVEATPERLDAIRDELGLDRPLIAQYFEWMGGVLTGDFGRSALTRSTVTSQLGAKLTITGPLILASTVLSLAVAVPLGLYAAVRHRRADGVGLSAIGQLGIAVPQFLVGITLIAMFAGKWGLPSQSFPRGGWDEPGRAIRALVLPTLTLATAQAAILLRFVRAATLDVLNQDYIRTARSKGLGRIEALFVHGLRNAAIPVVSVLGIQLATLIAAVVVIERVFNLPGVGLMLVKDIGNRDFDKVQGTILLIAAIVLVIGFLIDVVHHLIDPRLRSAG
jgi:peptide/nickel transport system permease protein